MSVEPISQADHLVRLAPDLKRTCDEYLVRYKDELQGLARSGTTGVALSRRRSRILDGLIGALFCTADATMRVQGTAPKGRVALAAVGGWGRHTVGLGSDIDALLLAEDPQDPAVRALAEAIFYPLWDLGLSVGHSVRGVHDMLALAQSDLRTSTTLLDTRRIAGDGALLQSLLDGARATLFAQGRGAFVDALATDRQSRDERFGASIFLLEPEVKLGRGGLRDLDVMRWAQAAESPSSAQAARDAEPEAIAAAEDFLWRVRNMLHLRAQRRQDRLTFEDQEEVAAALGFVDGVTLGVEQFMQAYYRHARVVAQACDRALSHSRLSNAPPTEQVRIADGLMRVGAQLMFEDVAQLQSDPALALRIYAVSERTHCALDPRARDAISLHAAERSWCERLRQSPQAAALFLERIESVTIAPSARGSWLGELHDVGLLLAMIPEFEPVTGRVQHDVYHVYTVDVHSIAALDRLRALYRGELAETLPLPSGLAADAPRSAALALGVLLHDIGKGRGGDHSARGAELASVIAPRLGMSAEETAHVVWLVQAHLSLYHWAMRRDLTDDVTLDDIVSTLGTPERLRDLYLLTIVDLGTTNPAALTSWKARMLDELYVRAHGLLENAAPSISADAEAVVERVASAFRGDERTDVEAFLATLPPRYLLTHRADAVEFHVRQWLARPASLHVATRTEPGDDFIELVVFADDRPGLLADVTAALSAHRLAVHAAHIYTYASKTGAGVLDIFRVRPLASARDWLASLVRDLRAVTEGRTTAQALLAGRSRSPSWSRRKAPDVRTEVRVDNDVSRQYTVIDVFARDRVGLLHRIARTLHAQGLSIALAKINTEGVRVADVFYVTNAASQKLGRDECAAVANALLNALHEAAIEAADDVDGEVS